MSDDILDFPTSEYANRIAGMEQWKSLQAVRECFQYAVEKNMGRAPIIKFLSSNADLISIYKDEPRRFVEWVADNCVYPGENGLKLTLVQPTGMRERSHSNEAYELLLNEVGALGREAAEKGSTPYGWFTAGWEVDSEIWSNIFGEQDPAITIAKYADQMLNGPGPNDYLHRTKTRLTNDDMAIIKLLIPLISVEVEKELPATQESPPTKNWNVTAAIKRVIFKEHFVDDSYAWYDPSFLVALLTFPPWLNRLLIDYFAGLDFDEMQPILKEREAARQLITSVVPVVTQAFMGALAPDNALKDFDKAFPGIKGIKPDLRNITRFVSTIEMLYYENDADIDVSESYPLRIAIYNLRATLFQHVLPFKHDDNIWIIEPIDFDDDGKFWLVPIASAEVNGGDNRPNPYGIIYWYSSQRREYRTFSYERLRLFQQAFCQIDAEGLYELAGAWWAFFIATQAMLYGHSLGLYPDELRIVAQTAESVITVQSVSRAVEFVRALAQSDNGLSSKVTAHTFSSFKPQGGRSDQVINLHTDPAHREKWLQTMIGPQVWPHLHQNSRQDLIYAEEIWNNNAYQFASSREDWGGIAHHYYRSIERECREQLRDFFHHLTRISSQKIEEPTLGVMFKLIRETRNRTLPSAIADKAKSLRSLLDEYKGLQHYRDDAAHGGEPIDDKRFTSTRNLIYRGKIFARIIDLSRAFDEGLRRRKDLFDRKFVTAGITDAEQQELAELDAFFVDEDQNRDKLG